MCIFRVSFFTSLAGQIPQSPNFGTVVGENPTPYGILALWAVNSLSIVYWASTQGTHKPPNRVKDT